MQDFFSRLSDLLVYDASNPMLFNSGLFMVLFVIFLLIYQSIRHHTRLRMLFAIAFSLYFYYKSSEWCVFILAGVCISDYLLGLWLGRTISSCHRKCIVALNVAINVGMLVYFKYFNLLYSAFSSIVSSHFEPFDIILPAGISFFTFRSISYMVDIYRGQIEPCRNFLNYTFYLTFFPPLLAGPVVRARDILPQVENPQHVSPQMISEALFLIMTGLVKKVLIADYISGNFVDRIFDNPMLYSGFENMVGCIGFTIQLYCDFSGYSDMAIGIALLLGYRFKENFAAPFKSQSPTEFWRRWHISLSLWLRDYIYIPLGGNRHGRTRAYINQMLTMVIGGLWHGASWMYILWGAYHGFLLIAHKALKSVWHLPENMKGRPEVKIFNIAITFVLVVAGFTLFRAPSLTVAGEIFYQIFTSFHLSVAPQFVQSYLLIVLAIAGAYIAHMAPRAWCDNTGQAYMDMPLVGQAILLAVILFLVVQTRQSELVPFIYLQY